VRLCNISSSATRVHVVPPDSDKFKASAGFVIPAADHQLWAITSADGKAQQVLSRPISAATPVEVLAAQLHSCKCKQVA
jgi:hypothetical protein